MKLVRPLGSSNTSTVIFIEESEGQALPSAVDANDATRNCARLGLAGSMPPRPSSLKRRSCENELPGLTPNGLVCTITEPSASRTCSSKRHEESLCMLDAFFML